VDARGLPLLAPLCFAAGFIAGRQAPIRRNGGNGKPRASVHMKGAATRRRNSGGLQPATATTALISSYSLRGAASADTAGPTPLRPANSHGAHGWSTFATATAGASGEPLASAAWANEYCRCGAHVVSEPCYLPAGS